MRVHRLEIQAFGPFAGHEVVDVDTLSDGGLFLLHGPTGAGKTSVLDAICFALYGRVPGSRGEGSRLRSDHADPGAPPQVVCEFSAGARRFEVTRSPAWDRPKRRGDGSTTEQARVLVRELTGGDWVALTTRIDEAAHLLEDVLGMGPDQFTKLVLLPQGDFAAFLRADAQVRRALLEKLFGTDRFTAVQDWLRERRAALRAEVTQVEQAGAVLLARAEQAGAAAFGALADRQDDDIAPAGELADQVKRLSLLAAQTLDDAVARRSVAESALVRARTAHTQAVEAAGLLREWLDLAARQRLLDGQAADQLSRQARLGDAERTQALAPLVPALRAARARDEAARSALAKAGSAYPGSAAVDDEGLAQEVEELRGALAALAPLEAELAGLPELECEVAGLAAAVRASEAELAQAAAAVQAADEQLARHTARAAEAAVRAEGVQSAGEALAAAQEVARAVLARDAAQAQVEALRDRHVREEAARNEAWQAWLDLRERRLAGIAAELAGGLVPGEACRVCGSLEHPLPAQPATAAVGADDEQAAHRAYTAAQVRRDHAQDQLSAAQSSLAAAAAVAGDATAESAAQALAAAGERAQAARDAAAIVLESGVALAALQNAAQDGQLRVAAAQERVAAARQSLARTSERLEGLHHRCDTARGEDADLPSRRRRLEAQTAAAAALLEARRCAVTAAGQLAELEHTAGEAAREAGFSSLDAATAATLDDAERAALQVALAAHAAQVAETSGRRAALAAPALNAVPVDLIDATDLEAVDAALAAAAPGVLDPARLAGLAHDLEQAQVHDAAAADRVSLCRNAAQQLGELAELARTHAQEAAPLQARFHTLDELARCVEGTGGENTRRMTLSAYVLAARLEQVAAAATLRLAQMSSGRYRLEHTDTVDRGRGRSGLSLEVVDSWTGSRRDTASLSGGESFYTSLALALGLADVVSAEAGGVSIETLFVDEGFGTLDDDTLEEVMDVLDGLRSNGRSIGIVSHVADLRSRIPAQLEVRKTEDGSTLRLVHAS